MIQFAIKYKVLYILVCLVVVSCKSGNNENCCAFEDDYKIVDSNVIEILESKAMDHSNMILIPAGTFLMGSDNEWSRADEKPVHQVYVDSFWMDETEVTNAQFKKFVDATGYTTTAERPFEVEGVSYAPGSLVFNEANTEFNPMKWWKYQEKADWKHPFGPSSSIDDIMDHPVVHISFEDARKYAKWAGKRLPTEAEWEYAAGNGSEEAIYPWGNDLVNSSKANYWQGKFPYKNEQKDGFAFTAPVKSFAPNSFGLYDMAGNVWEWCSDSYDFNYYNSLERNEVVINPMGSKISYDPDEPGVLKRVIKGGSFLCNDSYCSGYRVSAKMKTSEETSLQHLGFRCVKSIK
ncbi:MAG: formylglycine-generating enzyme family protein [Chitinophagales bacterium]